MIGRRKKIIMTAVLLFSLGVFSFYVKAQNVEPPTGLQISPMRFDWDVNSGDERTGIVNLKNYDKVPRIVDMEVQDFYVTDDATEARFFVPDQSHPLYAYDVINWIDLPKNIELAPGEGKDIEFHVKVPQEAPTGGYYGALFFKTKFDDASQNANAQVIVNQRIGALLVMAVKGEQPIVRSGDLKNFFSTHKVFFSKPAEFIADVYNSGNLHYKMIGRIDVLKFGSKIETINLEPRVLYPGKVRKYQQEWEFSPWAYGYYTAKIDMVSDDGAIRVAGQTSFWIIPWKTTVSLVILLVIIWLIFRLFTMKFEIRRKEEI